MKYNITMEDYLCLLQDFDYSPGFYLSDFPFLLNEISYYNNELSYNKCNNPISGLVQQFDEIPGWTNYQPYRIEGEKVINKNKLYLVQKHFGQSPDIRSQYGEIDIIKTVGHYLPMRKTPLALLIGEINKIKEYDFEALDIWCKQFLEFENLQFTIYLWGKRLVVRKVPHETKCWDYLVGSDEKHLEYFGDGKDIWVKYNLDGMKVTEYSKYKELEAFI